MHAEPAATESLTDEQCEPVNGGGGFGSVAVLHAPGDMPGILVDGGAAGGAMIQVPAGGEAAEDLEAVTYLAGYYLG